MSGFTPGPWEASRMLLPPNVKDRRCGFVVNGPDAGDDLPVRVCDLRVPSGISGFDEGRANANLIAAAPDLFQACIDLAQWVKENHPAIYADETAVIVGNAIAAIAKAKGQVGCAIKK